MANKSDLLGRKWPDPGSPEAGKLLSAGCKLYFRYLRQLSRLYDMYAGAVMEPFESPEEEQEFKDLFFPKSRSW